MELRHLRYFCAAAKFMHIGRAAESLCIAQPALTIQIKSLEAELGVALFSRKGRGVGITPAGQAFLKEAQAILEHVDRAKAIAHDIGTGIAGTLRVGFTESASFSPIVAQVLATFRRTRPEVELVLEEDLTDALAESVGQGRLDLAFVRPPVRTPGQLVLDPLGDEAMVVAMSRDHPLAHRSSLQLADLCEEDFVFRKRMTGLTSAVVAACREAGFTPRITQYAPQLSAVINLVAASIGIAVLPASMREVRPDRVVFIPLTDLPVRALLGLLRREHNAPAAQHLIDIASTLAMEQVPTDRLPARS